MNKNTLEKHALEARRNILTMIHAASSGHPGGSLSCTDLGTYLFFNEMNYENLEDENRDRFVLSKGHAAPMLYAMLMEKGYLAKEEMTSLRQVNSKLQGHPSMRKLDGIDMSTGSLGQGLSVANGMALGFKMDGKPNKVYAILGDGEMQEGMIWESAMFASHYELSNVTAILDNNGLQIDGKNEDVLGVDPLDKKWEAFGWHVIKCDGHDFDSIDKAFEERHKISDKPVIIIAKTIKGKGVSYMEDQAGWHGKAPNDEELEIAMKELGGIK